MPTNPSSSRFTGKSALVTGAGSGIGRATSKALAAEGAFVLAADVDAAAAERTAGEIGEAAKAFALDVADEAGWVAAIEQMLALRGRLDVLINSAGVSAGAPLPEMEFSDWRRVLTINLDGAFLGTKHAIRAMRESGGSIVHLSSASGVKAAAGAAAYSVSKAGLCMLAKSAAKECRDQKLSIRVNTVCPAGVKTPMWTTMPFFRDMMQQLGSEEAAFTALANSGGPFAEPEDIVAAILFLASDDAKHVTGADLIVDGGYVL